MIKKIIVSIILLMSFVSFAQEGTSSPYSYFGIGDVRFKGAAEYRAMGGLGVEMDSIHFNVDNPASYASLKLTTFSLGGTYGTTTIKAKDQSDSVDKFTLDYLAVGLPMGKFGMAFGLLPYSSVGYKIQSISDDPSVTSKRSNGSGGLNKVFLGMGYMISHGLSVGADVQYNFGKIETSSVEFIPTVPIGSQQQNSAELSGVNFNMGVMYERKLKQKLNFYGSASYAFSANVNSDNWSQISTGFYDANFNFTVVDSLPSSRSKVGLKVPGKFTFGAGIGEKRKWLIGAQATFQGASELENPTNVSNISSVVYNNYAKYTVGGYYIPNYNSFSSYFQRIVYRGGFRYEKSGLIINSEEINDVALTLGAGFPIVGTFSNINLGLELGKKGTTNSGLVQENYFNISLGFSLNDKWFRKTKFD
ncbi:hypothetical protein [Flavobacterium agrisoli]|uniref:Long-subunit fatty acid transport protein n=1 Tax=Flavobacterium agrisoli TaxID=2793066 RepID=A0A934PPF5_9FLAO|nr:hypothetical protein [Flavobacterium agrisoli]MBK0370688.1 hypothetical protein [Flavobacterium agrisoli]